MISVPDFLKYFSGCKKSCLPVTRIVSSICCLCNLLLGVSWSNYRDNVPCRTQKKFLQRAVELLAPNGDLVYTTTSMNPIENEAVVASILRMSAGK